VSWFRKHFPDALALIGEQALLSDFERNPRSSLISIKANPYHFRDSALIIGDAAHSMVPFYGQGLNCGLEDVRVLQTVLSNRGIDGFTSKETSGGPGRVDEAMQAALEEYSRTRHADLLAICDLAMHNYTEMRHDVTTPIYRVLKTVDTFLAALTPPVSFESLLPELGRAPFAPEQAIRGWTPLYTMVTFRPDISYALAQRRAARQSRTLQIVGMTIAGCVGSLLAWCARRLLF